MNRKEKAQIALVLVIFAVVAAASIYFWSDQPLERWVFGQ